ncbi:MAG: hypothetical protein DWB59_12845, partial [Anaerolineae bacterium]|nr:hypothetical protein [Anaerolineae bacterium]
GDYIVKVTPPAGYTSAVDTADGADTSNPNANTDDNDNGGGTSSGQVSSAQVTLTPGSAGAQSNNTVNNNTGTTTNPTLDFGFDTPIYSLGNRVWFDTDNDGEIDTGEVGADGVTVELYAADVSGNPTGSALATDTTAGGATGAAARPSAARARSARPPPPIPIMMWTTTTTGRAKPAARSTARSSAAR